jgi:hypothetical protein
MAITEGIKGIAGRKNHGTGEAETDDGRGGGYAAYRAEGDTGYRRPGGGSAEVQMPRGIIDLQDGVGRHFGGTAGF